MSERRAGPVLTLDRGNSTLDCMLWDTAGTRRERLDPEDVAALRDFLGSVRPARAGGLSVVAGRLDPARAMLADLGVPLLQAGDELPVPLRVQYADPTTLGVDRLVGAWAASVRHGTAVVVDCGTAVTVNLVRDETFLGGAIAPGADAMARALAIGAPALPTVDLDAAVALPANSAPDAVNAGVQVGFCSMVDGLVERLAVAAGMADAPRLVTGGAAGIYLRHGRDDLLHVPDLIHEGLRCLLRGR